VLRIEGEPFEDFEAARIASLDVSGGETRQTKPRSSPLPQKKQGAREENEYKYDSRKWLNSIHFTGPVSVPG
jgi:hypothetical protein